MKLIIPVPSDVLYRHMKVHTRKARNGRSSTAVSQDGISFHETIVLASSPQTLHLYENSESSTFPSQLPTPLPSQPGVPIEGTTCLDVTRKDLNGIQLEETSAKLGLNETIVDIDKEMMTPGPPSAEPLLVMSNPAPAPDPGHPVFHGEDQFMSYAKEPNVSGCNVAVDVLALDVLDTSTNLDEWALDLAQNSWPFQNNYHDFPASPLSYHLTSERSEPPYTPSQCREVQYSPS